MKLLLALAVLASPMAKPPCKKSPKVVGPCFTVHGRMRAGDGNPAIRIGQIRT
jgi:hypothetical protein